MSIIKNPEVKGILIIVLIIAVIAGLFAYSTGKLDKLFPGPRITGKIVFVSSRHGSNEIYTMNPDGSGQQALTKDANIASFPAISPLGNHIAFVSTSGSVSQVYSVNGRGEGMSRLTSATGPKSMPMYSPDGNKLAFIASGRTYISDLNGENMTTVLPTRGEMQAAMSSTLERESIAAYNNYAWSSNSNALVGITHDDSDNDMLVYLAKLDGGSAETLVGTIKDPNGSQMLVCVGKCGGQASPLFSVSGGHPVKINIACTYDKPIFAISVTSGNNSALLKFDASSETLTPVTIGQKLKFGKPAISPDGNTIVLPIKSSNKKIPSGLAKIDTQMKMIAVGNYENPAYSPKGDVVLAVRSDDSSGKHDIFSIDLASGETKQLTNDGASFNAIWSPVSDK